VQAKEETMAKHKKEKTTDETNAVHVISSGSGTASEAVMATYADGQALDKITYLEAKLILKPDRFASVQSFRDFGEILKRTAKKLDLGFIADPDTDRRPEIREITFGDTSDFLLYNNAFILRRRITYVDGFPVGDPEIVFKYRHPDEIKAAHLGGRLVIPQGYRYSY